MPDRPGPSTPGHHYLITVRDPVARTISAFNWRHPCGGGGGHNLGDRTKHSMDRWELKFYTCFETVDAFAAALDPGRNDTCGELATQVKATGADAAKPIGDEWLPERLRTKPEKPANKAARKAAAAATLREAPAERPRSRAERKERQKALDEAARREARAIAKKAPKPRREAPPAPPPRPATWAEFAFPAEGDVLEFCELCVWLFECFVCMAGFANLQTFAIYPLYSTAFATALIKGVECFVIGKFAPLPPAPDAADERDASPAPRRRTLSSGSHGSPKRNRKGSR